MTQEQVDGSYGAVTQAAVLEYQTQNGLKANGIATMEMQQLLDRDVLRRIYEAPETLIVVDDDDD